MTVDMTINLGQVLTLVGMLVALIASYAKTASKLAVMDHKIDILWEKFLQQRR
jgi:hypothetical protein